MGVHDVAQYPLIKERLGIPEDEPIFILRGQDKITMGALDAYFTYAQMVGCDEKFINSLEEHISSIARWQHENLGKLKIPD